MFERVEEYRAKNGKIQWEAFRQDMGIELSADALQKRYKRAMKHFTSVVDDPLEQEDRPLQTVEGILKELGFDPEKFSLRYKTNQSYKVEPKQDGSNITEDDLRALFDKLQDAPKAERAADPPKGKYGAGLMYMPSFCDLHFNKLCWSRETGANYDIDVASRIFRDMVNLDLRRIGDRVFDLAVIPFGNDLFNSDGNGTTTKGTPQDEDTRTLKAFERVIELFVEAIDKILLYAKEVRIVLVKGNHDELMSSLGAYCLSTWYRENPRISVDTSLRIRKYFLFGSNLIGLGHMDADAKRVPITIASEARHLWGDARFVEFHGAHLHTSDLVTIGNVKLMRNPSVTAPDMFHERNAYIAPRQHISYVYDAVRGPTETWIYNVPDEKAVW